jgi:hypothetical protein
VQAARRSDHQLARPVQIVAHNLTV